MAIDPTDVEQPDADPDLAFPIIPTEDDLEPPDGVDEVLADDLLDFAADDALDDDDDDDTDIDASMGSECAYDWDYSEFFAAADDPLWVDGADAVVERVNKALNTRQGEYPLYGPEYGSNVYQRIGQLPDASLFAEASRMISECCASIEHVLSADVVSIGRQPSFDPGAILARIELSIEGEDDPVTVEATF